MQVLKILRKFAYAESWGFGKILRMRRMPKIHRKIAYAGARRRHDRMRTPVPCLNFYANTCSVKILIRTPVRRTFVRAKGSAVVSTRVLSCRPKAIKVPYPVRFGLFGRRLEHNYIIRHCPHLCKPFTKPTQLTESRTLEHLFDSWILKLALVNSWGRPTKLALVNSWLRSSKKLAEVNF